MAATPGDPSGTGHRSRALWTLTSQGFSSLNGLASVVIGARALSPEEFGYFAAVLLVAQVVVGLITALLSQPLLITDGDAAHVATQARSTQVVATIFGGLLAVLVAAAWLVVTGLSPGLLILAASLPLLASAEVFRYVAIVMGRVQLAAILDASRLVLFVGMWVLVLESHGPHDGTVLVANWAGCAAFVGVVALILGHRLTRGAPAALDQFFRIRFLGYQFGSEFLITAVASVVPVLALGSVLSVEAVGSVRGTATLFGPMVVAATSAALFLVPIVVRKPVGERNRLLVAMAALLAGVVALWTVFLLLVPDSWGRAVLGDVWSGSRPLILPLGVQAVGFAVMNAALIGIRIARPRFSFVQNLINVFWSLACFAVGLALGDLLGAAWGLATGSVASALSASVLYVVVADRAPAGDDVEHTGF